MSLVTSNWWIPGVSVRWTSVRDHAKSEWKVWGFVQDPYRTARILPQIVDEFDAVWLSRFWWNELCDSSNAFYIEESQNCEIGEQQAYNAYNVGNNALIRTVLVWQYYCICGKE